VSLQQQLSKLKSRESGTRNTKPAHPPKKVKPSSGQVENAASGASAAQASPQPGTKRHISEVLSSSDTSLEDNLTEVESVGKSKPPPITVHRVTDFLKFSTLVTKDSPKDNPTTTKTLANSNVKVLTHSDDEYRRVIKLLQDSKYEYHHFQLKSEKPFRIVIRGLNPATPATEIKEGLEKVGHTVRSANNISFKKKDGESVKTIKLPLFFVDLEPRPNNKEVMEVRYLAYQRISVESPKPCKDVPQCKRCQLFGHTKNYCTLSPKCVKCGSSHLTAECTKAPNIEPTCANCSEAHPASWRGCHKYKEIYKSSRIQARPLQTSTSLSGTDKATASYSQVVDLQEIATDTYSQSLGKTRDSDPVLKQIFNLLSNLSKRLDQLENNGPGNALVKTNYRKFKNGG